MPKENIQAYMATEPAENERALQRASTSMTNVENYSSEKDKDAAKRKQRDWRY